MELLLVEIVFLHWLLRRSIKRFNNFLHVSRSLFVTEHLVKVYHDYSDAYLPGGPEINASCVLEYAEKTEA